MMSALVISIDMVDHDAWLSIDSTCSGYFPSLFAERGIAQRESFGFVTAQPGLRCWVDVCGRHWCEYVELRIGEYYIILTARNTLTRKGQDRNSEE